MIKVKTIFLLALLLLGLVANRAAAQQNPELIIKVIGRGQPIVLIPGLTCHGTTWDETVEAMGKGYQYHIITLPGFAGNPPLNTVEDGFFKQTKSMILDYIDQQKLKKPIIIGHSLGGFMALKIAIDRPDLPSKLVIVDALPYLPGIRDPNISPEQAKAGAIQTKNNMLANGKQPLEKKTAAQKDFLKWLIQDSKKIDLATQWYLDSHIESVAQAMYEMNTTDLRKDLNAIKVPTLVIGAWVAGKPYGATRNGTLSSYRAQYAALKGVQVDMTDKGYHFVMWGDPEFFISRIKKFL